ncbi:MAG: hypothetical protein HS100_04460 [Anaerolineales bacterium]|nr:hypothetical protein [Anaerolineales bacterium]
MARRVQGKRAELLAGKIMDWGNLVFVGFVIGQIVPGTSPIRWGMFLLGICGFAGAYIVANQLMKGVMRV